MDRFAADQRSGFAERKVAEKGTIAVVVAVARNGQVLDQGAEHVEHIAVGGAVAAESAEVPADFADATDPKLAAAHFSTDVAAALAVAPDGVDIEFVVPFHTH